MFELSYYAPVGQHGTMGKYHSRKSTKAAVKKAMKKEYNADLQMIEAVEYNDKTRLSTGETIIYHMTQPYLNHMESLRHTVFADSAAYHQYMAAAYTCMRTGKPVRFRYV